jgi:hypothetical protein
MSDLVFDGAQLTWKSNGGKTYKATTGIFGYQNPLDQKIPDAAIPAGNYWARLVDGGETRVLKEKKDAAGNVVDLDLDKDDALEKLPKDYAASDGQVFAFTGWGTNRLRLAPENPKATHGRGGFYIHDSTKGFSHGCIETERNFFADLRAWMGTDSFKRRSWSKKKLTLSVTYRASDMVTNGGTGTWTPDMEKKKRDQDIADGTH